MTGILWACSKDINLSLQMDPFPGAMVWIGVEYHPKLHVLKLNLHCEVSKGCLQVSLVGDSN